MAATAAQLVVDVVANTSGAEKGLDTINKKVKDAPGLFGAATKGIVGMVTAGLGLLGLGLSFGYIIKQASDSQAVIAQTNQLLLSTHDASGMSAQGITDLTNHLKDLTGIDDDVVRVATNMLLSFTRIGKDTFPQATQSALDLATFLNKGLVPSQEQVQSSAILIGKALNDPIHGMTALQRVGITLSDTQKEQIKHFMAVNDVAGAQNVILQELQKETGGAAEAAGGTFAGQLAKLGNALNDIAKALGFFLLPILTGFLQLVLKIVQPLGDGLGNALQKVQDGFKALGDKLAPLQKPWKSLTDGAAFLWHIFTENLKPALDDIGTTLGSLFNPNVQGAADTLQGFITNVVWRAAPIVKRLAEGLSDLVKNGLQKLQDFLHSDFVQKLQDISDNMKNQLGPAVRNLGDWFRTQLLPALKDAKPKFDDLANTFATVVVPAAIELFGHLEELRVWLAVHILPILEKIIPPLVEFAGTIAGAVSDAIKNAGPFLEQLKQHFQDGKDKLKAWQPVLDQVGNFIGNVVAPNVKNLAEKVKELLPHIKEFGQWAQEHLVPVVKDLAEKFKEAQPHIQQLANDIATRLAPILKNIGEFIQNVVLPVLGKIGEFIQTQIQPKLEQFKQFWDTIWPGIQQTIATVWGVIQGIITIAWSIISGIIKIGLDILGGNWGQAWKDMQDMFSGIWKGIQQIGESLFGKLRNFIVSKAMEIKGNVVLRFHELKDEAGKKINELKDNIINTVTSIPGKLKDLGGQMVQKLIDGIQNMAGNLKNTVNNIIHNAFSNLPGGIHIPGFASGTDFAPGGLAWVGEGRTAELVVGPHLMNLPRGSQVLPVTGVQQTQPMAAATRGNTYITNIYPQQATIDTQELARIQRRRDLLNGLYS